MRFFFFHHLYRNNIFFTFFLIAAFMFGCDNKILNSTARENTINIVAEKNTSKNSDGIIGTSPSIIQMFEIGESRNFYPFIITDESNVIKSFDYHDFKNIFCDDNSVCTVFENSIVAIGTGTTTVSFISNNATSTITVYVTPIENIHPFPSQIYSVSYGDNSGFGQKQLPDNIFSAPKGNGHAAGSVDVLSLGNNGTITLSFDDIYIVDGIGNDFTVFENAFGSQIGETVSYTEPAQVSIYDNYNSQWKSYMCSLQDETTLEQCAGILPVFSNSEMNKIPYQNRDFSGGDSFDLHDLKVFYSDMIQMNDLGMNRLPHGSNNAGFDLDALAAINYIPKEITDIEIIFIKIPDTDFIQLQANARFGKQKIYSLPVSWPNTFGIFSQQHENIHVQIAHFIVDISIIQQSFSIYNLEVL